MKLKRIVEELGLVVLVGQDKLDHQVTGGYVSDLLSDVIANSKAGNIWVTLQTHENVVAVASMKDLAAVVITNSREPAEETIEKAKEEGIPIMITKLSTFEVAGRLYQLGLR